MKVVFVVDRFCDAVKKTFRDKYERDTAADARKYGLDPKPVFKTELAAWDFIVERGTGKSSEARNEYIQRSRDTLIATVYRDRLKAKRTKR